MSPTTAIQRAEQWRKENACGEAAKVAIALLNELELVKASILPQPVYHDSSKCAAACRTLDSKGYTFHGGMQWKPPLGEPAAWVNPQMQRQAMQVSADPNFDGYERRKAIQEGEQNAASDAYFCARTHLMDTTANRNIYRAGFNRGYEIAHEDRDFRKALGYQDGPENK